MLDLYAAEKLGEVFIKMLVRGRIARAPEQHRVR